MQQAPPPTTLQITIKLASFEPASPGANPATEHVVPDVFDERTVSQITKLVHAIVPGNYAREGREDCLQETLIHLWQIMNADPTQEAGSHLMRCGGFIRDRLKHGRSIDSPKRRRFGSSIDAMDFWRSCDKMPQLVSNSTPHHHASARDATEQLRVRLKLREQRILLLLLEGNGTREVARRLRICASVVSKGTRRIRALALEIGLEPRSHKPSEKEK